MFKIEISKFSHRKLYLRIIFPYRSSKSAMWSRRSWVFTFFLMGLVQTLNLFILLRFIHGVFSAFVLILGTSIILPHIQELGKIFLSTAHFSGVGLGMFLSSLLVSLLWTSVFAPGYSFSAGQINAKSTCTNYKKIE